MVIENLIKKFEDVLNNFKKIFEELPSGYFFTEKEIHSYFYHLCLESNDTFTLHKDSPNEFNLVHAEYPTPFKCSIEKEYPYIKMRSNNEKCLRSHLDMVLFNPNFIKWVREEKPCRAEYIKGTKNAAFPDYIKDLIQTYTQFYNENKEAIFLYLLEFKYFRSNIEGKKQPLQSVIQDVEKLKMTKEFKMSKGGLTLPFAAKILSLVFINRKSPKHSLDLKNKLMADRVIQNNLEAGNIRFISK